MDTARTTPEWGHIEIVCFEVFHFPKLFNYYYPGWLAISSSGELSNEPPSTALWSPFTPLFAGMLIVCEMWAWLRGLRRAVEFRGKCWHVLYPVGIFIIMCKAVYL